MDLIPYTRFAEYQNIKFKTNVTQNYDVSRFFSYYFFY